MYLKCVDILNTLQYCCQNIGIDYQDFKFSVFFKFLKFFNLFSNFNDVQTYSLMMIY